VLRDFHRERLAVLLETGKVDGIVFETIPDRTEAKATAAQQRSDCGSESVVCLSMDGWMNGWTDGCRAADMQQLLRVRLSVCVCV